MTYFRGSKIRSQISDWQDQNLAILDLFGTQVGSPRSSEIVNPESHAVALCLPKSALQCCAFSSGELMFLLMATHWALRNNSFLFPPDFAQA